MAWTISFKSFDNSDIVVSIGGGSGQIVGAAHPFVTEEDESFDMFTPVRLQSGYINFYDDDDSTWISMIPIGATSRPVEVTKGGYTVWRGFLKPETYGGEYGVVPQVRQMPVVCILSVLSAYQLPTTPPSGMSYTPTFVQLINYIIGEVATDAGMTIGINWLVSNQTFETWKGLHVQWGNLMVVDDTGNVVPRLNNLELLEEICKYLGVTARTWNGDVYFTMADDAGWRTPLTEIDASAGFNMAGIGTEEFVQGCSRATVTSDINSQSTLISMPGDKILEENISGAVTDTTYGTTGKKYEKAVSGTDYDFGTVAVETSGNAGFEIVEYIDDTTGMNNIVHDWSCQLTLTNNAIASGTYAKFSTPLQYALSGGKLIISGSAFLDEIVDNHHSTKYPVGNVRCRLRIGDYYWTGYNWEMEGTEKPTFQLTVKDGQIGKGDWYATQQGTVWEFEAGYTVPVTALSGDIEFEILTGLIASTADLSLKNIKIEYTRGSERNKNQNVFRASGAGAFADQWSINTIFASDGVLNAYGLGLVLDNSGNYFNPDLTNEDPPEQRLAYRMAYYGQNAHRVLTLPLYGAEGINPSNSILDSRGDILYPISINYDWWEAVTTIKMIQL